MRWPRRESLGELTATFSTWGVTMIRGNASAPRTCRGIQPLTPSGFSKNGVSEENNTIREKHMRHVPAHRAGVVTSHNAFVDGQSNRGLCRGNCLQALCHVPAGNPQWG